MFLLIPELTNGGFEENYCSDNSSITGSHCVKGRGRRTKIIFYYISNMRLEDPDVSHYMSSASALHSQNLLISLQRIYILIY